MDAGIGCRWIPVGGADHSGGRLAFRPREVSGAGGLGRAPAFGLRANGRLRACRHANGHLQGAGRRCLCRVFTVACRVAGLGIFLERLAAGPPRMGDVLVGIFHTGCICLVRGIEGLERILTAN